MNTSKPVYLDHKFLLTDIAKRIASGESITIKEISSGVTRLCPSCGEPVIHHPHNTHWMDQREDERIEAAGQDTYTDGDLISIQEVEDSFATGSCEYLDLDANLMSGKCHFCGGNFAEVEVYCFNKLPRPENPADVDTSRSRPPLIYSFYYDDLVRSVEDHRLCLVCLGEDPIGVMHYGKNMLFNARSFYLSDSYLTEDFVSDCCAFCLDCISADSQLDASPIGVVCGHYDLNDTKSDWDAAAVIAMALYRVAKDYMHQV